MQDRDRALEDLFAAARAAPPEPPRELLDRVQADARAAQPAAPLRPGDWLRALGGLAGVGSMATATCLGLWLGVAPPEGVPDFGGYVLGLEEAEPPDAEDLSGFGWDSDEG